MKKIKNYQSFLESFKFLNENIMDDEGMETQKETGEEGMETETDEPTWDEGMETEESPEYDEPMGDEGECDTCD